MSSIVPFICTMMILNNGLNKSHHSSYEDHSHVSHNLFSEETNRYANISSSYPNQWSDTISALGARMNNITPVNGFYCYSYSDITCAKIVQFRSSQYQGLNDPYSIEQIERIRTSCQTANIEALRGQIDALQCNILRQNLYSNAIKDLQNCVEKVTNESSDDQVVATCSTDKNSNAEIATKEKLRDLLNEQMAASLCSFKEHDILTPNEVRQEFERSTIISPSMHGVCVTSIREPKPIVIQSESDCPGSKTKDKKSFVQKFGDALYKVTDILNMFIDLFISDDF